MPANCPRNMFTGLHTPGEINGRYICSRCGQDVTRPKPKPNPRSVEAALSLDAQQVSDRERAILVMVGEAMTTPARGLTTWELEQRTGGKHQSVSATVSRLFHDRRLLRPSGRTRLTDTARRADVYELGDPQAVDAPVQSGVGQKDRRRRKGRIGAIQK